MHVVVERRQVAGNEAIHGREPQRYHELPPLVSDDPPAQRVVQTVDVVDGLRAHDLESSGSARGFELRGREPILEERTETRVDGIPEASSSQRRRTAVQKLGQ